MSMHRRDYIRRTKRALMDFMHERFPGGVTPEQFGKLGPAFHEFFKGWGRHPRAAFRLLSNYSTGDQGEVLGEGPVSLRVEVYDPYLEELKKKADEAVQNTLPVPPSGA